MKLKEYRVSLREEPGDTDFLLLFVCWAEDKDHAGEQAWDAYPGCEVKHIVELEVQE